MEAKTRGLILRTRLLTETSLIVHWVTPEFGRVATVAKGARRPKSPFLGKLDLFYEADFTFTRSRRSDLHTLREVRVSSHHVGLRRDLARLRQASYFVRLIEQNTESETPIAELFELVRDAVQACETSDPGPIPVLAFELKLLGGLGMSPETPEAPVGDAAGRLMALLAAADWASLPGLTVPAGGVQELDRFLHRFMVYHLGRVPPGRDEVVKG